MLLSSGLITLFLVQERFTPVKREAGAPREVSIWKGAAAPALLGLIGGIWAEKFDHIAAVTNFVVVPLSFLSGTFYSVERLPENWLFIAHLNPFFYLIDGFRYGLIGVHDGNVLLGALVVGAVNAVLWALAYGLVSRGYKLKP